MHTPSEPPACIPLGDGVTLRLAPGTIIEPVTRDPKELPAQIQEALQALRDGCGPETSPEVLRALEEVEAAHRRRLREDEEG